MNSTISLLPGLLPILEVNGTSMKHHTYHGSFLLAICQTADDMNVPSELKTFVGSLSTLKLVGWI
jgi:hypothetical protein